MKNKKIEVGDIALVPFPFTHLDGSKVRPVLVLHVRTGSPDIVVAFITSRKTRYEFSVPIMVSENPSIKIDSWVLIDKIATLDKKIFIGVITQASVCTREKAKELFQSLVIDL